MADRFDIPPEDQAAWSDLLGLDSEPVDYVCADCKMPVERTTGGWQHAELADAVFCHIVFGTALPGGAQ